MALPGVSIEIGSGGLGRVAATSDGVAGLILTGRATYEKDTNESGVKYDERYQISSLNDLNALGITMANNPLAAHEVQSFYAQAGEGSELHLMLVAEGTRLSEMVTSTAERQSPLAKLVESAGGRIRIVGINRLAQPEEEENNEQGIDEDAIIAAQAAQDCAESFASRIMPVRIFLPAERWKQGGTWKPSGASFNRVAMVLASDYECRREKEDGSTENPQYPAAIGLVLGRAAKAEPQQDLGRVKFGSIAAQGYFTDGTDFLEKQGEAEALNDAGYIFFMNYPGKNGCYLNGCPMATSPSDDYATLNNGRIMDKAVRIAYDTYISEIMDNVQVGEDGKLPSGVCTSFESMIENAVASLMDGQISSFKAYVDPEQNILSTSKLTVECRIVPLGVLKNIRVTLAFSNPALEK